MFTTPHSSNRGQKLKRKSQQHYDVDDPWEWLLPTVSVQLTVVFRVLAKAFFVVD